MCYCHGPVDKTFEKDIQVVVGFLWFATAVAVMGILLVLNFIG